VPKRLADGHPNVVDVIESGHVGAVVNTVTGRRGPLKDGFRIRRAAVERRVACFTSIDTARVAVEVLARGRSGLQARPLQAYLTQARLESGQALAAVGTGGA
jgi:carbamoyl-phosphate synthase large subunit